jgi:hypothetical protein
MARKYVKNGGGVKADPASALDHAICAAREAHERLHDAFRVQEGGLTSKAFIAEAMANATVTDDELADLATAIDRAGNEQAKIGLASAVRSITHQDRDRRMSRPHKHVRNYWSDDGHRELAGCGANALQAFALASKIAAEFAPTAFGEIKDWEKHEQLIEQLRLERLEALATVARSWGPGDVVVGEDGVVTFRRWPSVQLTSVDLAERVLDAATRAPVVKTSRPRGAGARAAA